MTNLTKAHSQGENEDLEDPAVPANTPAKPANSDAEQTLKRRPRSDKENAKAWKEAKIKAAKASQAATKRKKDKGFALMSVWMHKDLITPIRMMIDNLSRKHDAALEAAKAQEKITSRLDQEMLNLSQRIGFEFEAGTDRLVVRLAAANSAATPARHSMRQDNDDVLLVDPDGAHDEFDSDAVQRTKQSPGSNE